MEQEQKPSSMPSFSTFTNWFVIVIQSLALSVEVFLRRGFGERYIGLQGGIAALLILLFSMLFPGQDVDPLFTFLIAYLAMCVIARAAIAGRCRRGTNTEHSRYSGWPRLMGRRSRWSEITFKRFAEPLIVFVVGCVTYAANVPLGSYFIVAAFALALSSQVLELRDRKRSLDMHDAVIEATQRAERFRALNGDRR